MSSCPALGFTFFSFKGTCNKETRVVQTPGSDTVGNVVDLCSGTTYKFLVIAENDVGESRPSSSLQVTLAEEGKICKLTTLLFMNI